MKWQWTLIGFICLVIVSVIGGIAFHFLEADNETQVAAITAAQLHDFIDSKPCINMSNLLTVSNMFKLIKFGGVRFGVSSSMPVENITDWDLESSIFLAFQVMGSVGFGNAPPITTGGRVFCVFFALIGIPLFFVASYGVGQLLSLWVDRARCAVYRRLIGRCPPRRGTLGATVGNTTSLFVVGFVLFVLVPAAIFKALETWTFGEAMFCALMTTLTIGFTDFVPGENAPDSYRKAYKVIVGLWIMIDLYWFAGVLMTIKDIFHYSEQVQKPLDEAIHEDQTTDDNGQKKIRVGKNWKKKNFDKQWQKSVADQSPMSADVGRSVEPVNVVPIYAPNRLYPSVMSSAVDSRLTVFTPTSPSSAMTGSNNNISQVTIGS